METCTQCNAPIEADDKVWSRNMKSKDDWKPYHAGHEPQVDYQTTSLTSAEYARLESNMQKEPKEPCSVCGGMFWPYQLACGYWDRDAGGFVDHESRCRECNEAARACRQS